MTTLTEYDLKYSTNLTEEFKSLPIDKYLEFLTGLLKKDFDDFHLLKDQLSKVLKGETINLIDISLVLKVLYEDTSNKLSFLTNHVISAIESRKNNLDEKMLNDLRTQMKILYHNTLDFNSYREKHLRDLKLYDEYNNYLLRGGDKMTFLDYKSRNESAE